jgi:hypothetical protein
LSAKLAIFTSCVFILGFLAIGCGDSDSGSSDGEGSIDRATFVKQADTICKKISGRMAAELKALGEGKSRIVGSEGETALEVLKQIAIPGYEEELEEIRALGIPSDDQAQVKSFIEKMEKMIASAKSNPQDFGTGAAPAYEAVELSGRQLGITACPTSPVGAN